MPLLTPSDRSVLCGRNAPEQVAAFKWNKWPDSVEYAFLWTVDWQRQRVQRERDVMAQKLRENKATEGREKVRERWSAQQKTEVVLRLLRGEDLVEVSRAVQVSPPELEEWRRVFLETGEQGLRRRGRDPGERELTRTQAKLGELTMRLELARELLEKRGYGDELRTLLKRGRE